MRNRMNVVIGRRELIGLVRGLLYAALNPDGKPVGGP